MSSSPPPHGAVGVKPLLNMKSIHRAPGQAPAIKADARRGDNHGCSKGLQPDLTTGSLAPRQDRPPCRPRRRVPRFMGPGCANANGGLTETWSAAGSGVPVEQRRIADQIGQQMSRTAGSTADLIETSAPMSATSAAAIAIHGASESSSTRNMTFATVSAEEHDRRNVRDRKVVLTSIASARRPNGNLLLCGKSCLQGSPSSSL